MGDISPVLQAFLAGQGGQNDLLRTAQSIVNQRNEQQTRVEAQKSRQQEIANQLKHFDAMSKQADAHHELETEIFNLHRKQAHMAAVNDIRDKLRTGEIPLQGTNFSMPGMKHVQVGGEETQDPATNRFQANPTQQVDTGDAGFGMISVPTPETDTQAAVAKQAALLPGLVKQYEATTGSGIQAKLDSAEVYHKMQTDMLNKWHQMQSDTKDREMAMRETLAEMRGTQSARDILLKLGYVNPEQNKQIADQNIMLSATGHLSPEMLKAMTPADKIAYEHGMAAQGFQRPAEKDMADINTTIGAALQTLNSTQKFLADNPAPTTAAAKGANWLVNNLGLNRDYKNYKATTISNMEQALKLPLGRINGSPAILKQFEPMLVQPFEGPSTVGKKMDQMADVFMSGLSQTLNKYRPDQRKMLLREIIDSSPDIENNAYLSKKIHNFLDTGIYNAKVPKVN